LSFEEKLAAAIRDVYPDGPLAAFRAADAIIIAASGVLDGEKPYFSRSKFLRDCGVVQ